MRRWPGRTGWPARSIRASPYSDPEKIDPVSGELRVFLDGATMLAADLGRVAAADLWIWPSLFAPQLYASVLAKPGVPVSGCLHIEPTYRAPNGRMWWGYAFLAAREAGLGLNIGANVPELVREYSSLAGGALVSLFPVASDGVPGPQPRTELRTIGFFGYQRKEKGLDVLAGLVPRLLREGYQVVLQDSGTAVRAVPGSRLAVLGYGRIAEAAREASGTWRDAHGMRHFALALLGTKASPS